MKIFLTGSAGMLGRDMSIMLTEAGHDVICSTRLDLDVTDREAVYTRLNACSPDIVIHAAAYTNVDMAESEPDIAYTQNALSSKYLAECTSDMNIPIVYISTDYVFGGDGRQIPYMPSDMPCPINAYGHSKAEGEAFIQSINPRHYICRTSWLYGQHGKNFVQTMIQNAHRPLRVVNDQWGSPTSTVALSRAVIDILDMPYGIYHTSCAGQTTWYDYACRIFHLAGMTVDISPCLTSEYIRPAKRPIYSVLGDSICPDWAISLSEYMQSV